jgi:glycosyltransferase involved in cell wall biosynthesis
MGYIRPVTQRAGTIEFASLANWEIGDPRALRTRCDGRMRITFILPNVSMGGGTRVVAIYARELLRRGHEVEVVSLPLPARSLREKLTSWLKGMGWSQPWSHSSHFDELKLSHRVLKTRRPIVDADIPDADIVIATWWETAEWVHELSPSKGTKIYFIQHHEVFPYLPARSRETYRMLMHKIVVARWLKHVMIEEYDDDIVDVVPNSVDHSQFFAPVRGKQPRPTVGVLYATAPFKGLDSALAALEILTQRIPNLHVVSFGSERVRPRLDLPKGAEFHFDPPQDEIRNLYAKCDVWVTASTTEGFNLPAMEAMACRTPVVSTCTGWPAEAVMSEWNGMLLNVGSGAEEIARGVEWVLLQSEQEWARLSSNAFHTVAESSWEKSAGLFEDALMNGRRRSASGEVAESKRPKKR